MATTHQNNRMRPMLSDGLHSVKEIVRTRTMGKVHGTRVDLYSASAISSVYDRLSPENQAKLLKLPVAAAAKISLATIARAGARR